MSLAKKQAILIAGGGSIGSVLGINLVQKGYNIELLRRRKPFGKFKVQMIGAKELEIEIQVHNSEKISSFKPDIIVITTQIQQTSQLIQTIQSKYTIKPNTIILTLLNGLSPALSFCQFFPHQPIIQGTVWWSATLISSTLIYYHRQAPTVIGIPECSTATDKHLTNIADLISSSFVTHVTKDIQSEARKKLILNVVSPVLALVKQPYPSGLKQPFVREIIHTMFDEAIEIALNNKWDIEDPKLDAIHRLLMSSDPLVEHQSKSQLSHHKVSTQISAEKYGGKGSNARELLSFFIKHNAKICRRILEEIEQLPINYNRIENSTLQQIFNQISNQKCIFQKT